MKISFDPAERLATLTHRGLEMARAVEVFDGPTLTVSSDRGEEPRFFTLGWLADRMIVMVWTPRDGGRRIISMRIANESERRRYGPRLVRP